ncbi:MAG: hypothetical protein KDI88_06455 [Gammaproteobacteria bacterium]|nr:hypothetical protein [Gammaproteobacteria bacterium]
MPLFAPCQGKTACRDDGQRCLTCGRSLAEIGALRGLIGQLADLAIENDYGNPGQYVEYVATRLQKVIAHRQKASHAAP